jgi:hypothetical protein
MLAAQIIDVPRIEGPAIQHLCSIEPDESTRRGLDKMPPHKPTEISADLYRTFLHHAVMVILRTIFNDVHNNADSISPLGTR